MRIIVTLLIVISSCTRALAQTSNDLFDVNVLQEIRLDVKPADWQAIQDNPRPGRTVTFDRTLHIPTGEQQGSTITP